jgi:hypothetical protein
MIVLSTRLNEKVFLPEAQTTIEVVAVQGSTIRLGVSTPEQASLPECTPEPADRVLAAWGPDPEAVAVLPAIKRLLDKRLEIAREGLSEVRQCLRAGLEEDARVLLEKVDEDLHLLRRRLRREIEKAETLTCGV